MKFRLSFCALAGLTLALLPVAGGNTSATPAPRLSGGTGQPSSVMQAGSAPVSPREQSKINLQMLGVGIVKYLQDHDERFPDAARWVDEIMPYVKNKKYFHDPSAPASQAYSYAYNRAFSHKSLAEVAMPSEAIILFESTKGVKNASDTGQSVPRPGRHDGGTQYAFADGHVKWFPDGKKPSFKVADM